MAVLRALRRSPGALVRNPVLLVPILVLLASQVPPLLLQAVDPLLSSLLSMGMSLVFIAVTPLFMGGTIAMANEALDGRTSLQTFLDSGTSNYVALLVAYLVLLAAYFVLGLIGFVLGIVGFASVAGSGGLQSANLVVLAVVGIVVAVLVLAYLTTVFFLQFYGQAIVLEDLGAIEGLKRSAAVVRANLVSTLGYSLLVGATGGLVGGVFAAASFVLSPRPAAPLQGLPAPSLGVVSIAGVAMLVVGTLVGTFFLVFSVAFYREVAA